MDTWGLRGGDQPRRTELALTSQRSAHCTDCDGKHLPGEPHISRTRPRNGGRHLAPKTAKPAAGPGRRADSQRETPPKATAAPRGVNAKTTRVPRQTAEELGTSTAHFLRTVGKRGRRIVRGIALSCQQWLIETKRGLRDLVDLESLKLGAEESRHVDKAIRSIRSTTPEGMNRPVSEPGQGAPGHSPSQVDVLSRSDANREHLLEVSVLESLGFFDPIHEIVVTMGSTETSDVAKRAPVPAPQTGGRQLIPDVDLKGWKPHVIARSKLGKGRFSTTMIAVLAITLLIMAVIATNLFRAPAEEAALEEDTLAQASTQLAITLEGLEPVLADVTADVADATSNLMSVDSAARDLFEAAALLGSDPEQQVLRQSAASLAQRSLALETTIGDALNYRMVLNPLWNSPDLAGVVDPTDAAAEVAAWQARLADMVESLPTSQELGVHVEQVRAFVDGLDDWRVRYLDALSVSDFPGAEAAVADLDGQLGLLAQSGEEILSGLFERAGTERSRILADIPALSG